MTVLITNGATTLNTASGFYRIEAQNLGCFHATLLALTTTRYINVTFANAGNCQGIVLNPNTVSMTNREMIVKLEEYQTVTSFDTATEKILKNSHGLNDLDLVSFTSTGTLPTGITSATQYYVRNKTANDFQISATSGGSIIGLSGTPSGTASVGVERATKTMTTSEIAGEGMFGTYKVGVNVDTLAFSLFEQQIEVFQVVARNENRFAFDGLNVHRRRHRMPVSS